MRYEVLGDTRLRVTPAEEREIVDGGEASFGPLQMLAGSLAGCTLAVLWSWARAVEVPADDLAVEVEWTYADDPYRVDRFTTRIRWPSLPAEREDRARRVAGTCTVHHTFEHPPSTEISLELG